MADFFNVSDVAPGIMRNALPPVAAYQAVPGTGNVSNATPTLNELRLAPWVLSGNSSWDRFYFEIASGVATAVFRCGIYKDTGQLYPGTLVQEFAAYDVSVTGKKTNTISLTLPAGVYWVGGAMQVAASQLVGTSNGQFMVNTQDPNASNNVAGYSQASVSGALPSTFSSTIFSTSNAPQLFLRRSA